MDARKKITDDHSIFGEIWERGRRSLLPPPSLLYPALCA